jgi:hypothetical protein
MTMKSTLIVPMALLAALAAGVLVHDHLRTKSFAQDAALTRTASIATATPAAPAPVSPPPVTAPAPAMPEPEPPQRMTASQEASLDAWMTETYFACWKPAAQPADANPYVARVRLKFKPDGSLLNAPKLVNPPSDPAQKPQAKSVLRAVKACDPLPVPAEYRSFYEQWKTKTILFDPRSPLADPRHEPPAGPEFESLHSGWDRPRSLDFSCATALQWTAGMRKLR